MKAEFNQKLLKWHSKNERFLPWKKYNDAYTIWLSEIIMQQTRVEQGSPYFLKFKEAYPTLADLAEAPLSAVIKLWEGLGYYNRARNMHKTAKHISYNLDGQFPRTYHKLLKLKGIGPYTAAAVSSFAFGEPKAAIDGNVTRLLSRFFGIYGDIQSAKTKKSIQKTGDKLIAGEDAGKFNQALMDFGSKVCTPKPDCNNCLMSSGCFAFINDKVASFPNKYKRPERLHRYFNFLVLRNNNEILLEERKNQDVWKNLFQFPMIETKGNLSVVDTLLRAGELDILPPKRTVKGTYNGYRQHLTHQTIHGQFVEITVSTKRKGEGRQWVNFAALGQYPFPKMIRDFLSNYSLS